MSFAKIKRSVKQQWKSRTVRANVYSLVALAVQAVALNPATFGITAPAQIIIVNTLNLYLRNKTDRAVKDLG